MINDPEIDLTEYQDFRGDNISRGLTTNNSINVYTHIQTIIKKQIYGNTFPWSVTPLFSKLFPFDGVFAIGNKEQRKEAIITRYWGCKDNVCCDCCGKKYIKIPWRKDWGLCKECNFHQQSFKERLPWDITRTRVQRFLGDFWTRERR